MQVSLNHKEGSWNVPRFFWRARITVLTSNSSALWKSKIANWSQTFHTTSRRSPKCKFPRTTLRVPRTFLRFLEGTEYTFMTTYLNTSWKSKTANCSQNFHTTLGSSSKFKLKKQKCKRMFLTAFFDQSQNFLTNNSDILFGYIAFVRTKGRCLECSSKF